MTFDNQVTDGQAYCVPVAPQLTTVENRNLKVIWEPLPPYCHKCPFKIPTSHSDRQPCTKSVLPEWFLEENIKNKKIKLSSPNLSNCTPYIHVVYCTSVMSQ